VATEPLSVARLTLVLATAFAVIEMGYTTSMMDPAGKVSEETMVKTALPLLCTKLLSAAMEKEATMPAVAE
jgi:hypothetical protein